MSDAYDYDYDTGSYTKNPVQVTRYRQNIQRFRDYGNVGQQSAPISEGRLKEGIQPGGYQFSPPSAGVSPDFYRDSRMRDPNQPPLDTSQISSLQYNRLFFEKDGGNTTDTSTAEPTSGRTTTTRTSTPSGIETTTTRRSRIPFRRARVETTVTPRTPAQQRAIEGMQAVREQRASTTPMQEPTRTPAPQPIEPNPIQRVEPSTTTTQREFTPVQQRAIEAVRQRRAAAQQPAMQQSTPAAKSSGSRAKKRPSKSGLGKVGRAILSEALPEARGYLNL